MSISARQGVAPWCNIEYFSQSCKKQVVGNPIKKCVLLSPSDQWVDDSYMTIEWISHPTWWQRSPWTENTKLAGMTSLYFSLKKISNWNVN